VYFNIEVEGFCVDFLINMAHVHAISKLHLVTNMYTQETISNHNKHKPRSQILLNYKFLTS